MRGRFVWKIANHLQFYFLHLRNVEKNKKILNILVIHFIEAHLNTNNFPFVTHHCRRTEELQIRSLFAVSIFSFRNSAFLDFLKFKIVFF
jgi:hypothetical protein